MLLAPADHEFLGYIREDRHPVSLAIRGFERATDADGEGRWVVVLNEVAEKLVVSRRQQHIVRELGRVL